MDEYSHLVISVQHGKLGSVGGYSVVVRVGTGLGSYLFTYVFLGCGLGGA